jgi:hypothetical protein
MSEGKAMTAEERAFRYLQERDDGERCACRDCLSDEIAALEAVILAAEQAAADEARQHMREDMPKPEGVCVCGHDAADHCEPGCCGASCRFPIDEPDVGQPPCRCRHFRRAARPGEGEGT